MAGIWRLVITAILVIGLGLALGFGTGALGL